MEIVVVARVRTIEGKEAEAERAFRDVIAPTHLEDGCLRYGLHRGADDRRILMMIERWSSRAALDAHLGSTHVEELFDALGGLLQGPAEITVLDPVSEDLGAKARIG